MRRAVLGSRALFRGERFWGVVMGADACAEHECGIRSLRAAFGNAHGPLSAEGPYGVERLSARHAPRAILERRLSDGSHLVAAGWAIDAGRMGEQSPADLLRALDLSARCHGNADGRLEVAWDEGSFALLFGPRAIEAGEAMSQAMRAGDLVIGDLPVGEGDSRVFTVAIRSRLSRRLERRINAEERNRQRELQRLDAAVRAEGFEAVARELRAAGCGWFALKPAALREGEVLYFLNPENQRRNQAGHYTLEELRAWARSEGPVVGHSRTSAPEPAA